MYRNTDLYLGVFLILSGFAISIVNMRRVIRQKKFSTVLLSENIILVCIGVAFITRAVYSLHPESVQLSDIETRMDQGFGENLNKHNCGFTTLLISYGPLIVSMVNSSLSLIIDNYMHYQMIIQTKQKEEENDIQEIGNCTEARDYKLKSVLIYFKKHINFLTIAIQWIVPMLIVIMMFPMQVKELSINEARHLEGTCMEMIDMNHNCFEDNHNYSLHSFLPIPVQYDIYATRNSSQLDSILENVLHIIKTYNNNTDFSYTAIDSPRRPKIIDDCFKICLTDNKDMLLYMFILAIICYFLPIIISTVILTKISTKKVNRPLLKTHVTRELLYNILFWTPVMFDTFLSLILCSFSMHSMKTSFFNVIANIYQAVKNFMNTKYFKENVIVPV